MSTAAHSYLLYDPTDTERTRLTEIAHEAARHAIEGNGIRTAALQWAFTKETHELYILEVHGQSSATSHGWQGLRPGRLSALRELNARGIPVLLIFCEGARTFKVAWMHDCGQAKVIAVGDPANREKTARYGWYAGQDPQKGEVVFEVHREFPVIDRVSKPKARLQEQLV